MNGNRVLQTRLTTKADQGVALATENALALHKVSITVTNVYTNSCLSRCVIYGLSSDIGTPKSATTTAHMVQEMLRFTNFSLVQPPRWLNWPKDIEAKGFDYMIVSCTARVEVPGLKTMPFFNHICRVEKAIPNHQLGSCWECQSISHHQDSGTNNPRCGRCADAH